MRNILKPETKSKAKPKAIKRKAAATSYVCLPHDMLWNPPVRHRYHSGGRRYLTPLQIAVASALVEQARYTFADADHQQALAHGAKQIKREKAHAADYQGRWQQVQTVRKRGWPALNPKRNSTTRGSRYLPNAEVIPKAGKVGYKQKKKNIRQTRKPEDVTIRLSRYQLLRVAQLVTNGSNRRKLDVALRRLLRPTMLGEDWYAPVLRDWDEDGGGLRLVVAKDWLPTQRFQCVPTPLPRRPTVLALYLLLHVLNISPLQTRAMHIGKLYASIGIVQGGSAYRQRAFERALDGVNRHLDKLDVEALDAKGIKVPARYGIKVVDDEHLLFTREQRPVHEFEEESFEEEDEINQPREPSREEVRAWVRQKDKDKAAAEREEVRAWVRRQSKKRPLAVET